jgi:hypothetical protein
MPYSWREGYGQRTILNAHPFFDPILLSMNFVLWPQGVVRVLSAETPATARGSGFRDNYVCPFPFVIYPTWRKRQQATPAERQAVDARRKVPFHSFGICMLVCIPSILLICVLTPHGRPLRQIGVARAAIHIPADLFDRPAQTGAARLVTAANSARARSPLRTRTVDSDEDSRSNLIRPTGP